MKKILATNTGCHPCLLVKQHIEKIGAEVEIKDYSDPANKEFFDTHNIRSVPVLVMENAGQFLYVRGLKPIIDSIDHV